MRLSLIGIGTAPVWASVSEADSLPPLARYEQEYGAAGEYAKYGAGGPSSMGGYPAQHGQYGVFRAEETRRISGRYPPEYDEVRRFVL